MGGKIGKKDIFWIILAGLLGVGIWALSAYANQIKNWFRPPTNDQYAAALNSTVPQESTNPAKIRIVSPLSNQIIKGTRFSVSGQVSSDTGRVLILILDTKKTLASEIIDTERTEDAAWNRFNKDFDLKNYNGYANIEILSFPESQILSKFQIRIIKSL